MFARRPGPSRAALTIPLRCLESALRRALIAIRHAPGKRSLFAHSGRRPESTIPLKNSEMEVFEDLVYNNKVSENRVQLCRTRERPPFTSTADQ
jgi:hypothetical protein